MVMFTSTIGETVTAIPNYDETLADLFGDCQDHEEEMEFAQHIATQGAEAGFSRAEVLAAQFFVALNVPREV